MIDSAKCSSSQDDFDSLTCPHRHLDGCAHELADHNVFAASESSTKHPKNHSNQQRIKDAYEPVNYINDEVYAFMEAWEECASQRAKSSDVSPMDRASSASEAVYEPIRHMQDAVPPKRFYRTFWRSAARRVLRQEREAHESMETEF